MHDRLRPQIGEQTQRRLAVTDVQFVVGELRQGLLRRHPVPSSVARWTEEHRPLIVVDTVHVPAFAIEVRAHFAAEQTGRTRHQDDSPSRFHARRQCSDLLFYWAHLNRRPPQRPCGWVTETNAVKHTHLPQVAFVLD
jgi:hypothetical protein